MPSLRGGWRYDAASETGARSRSTQTQAGGAYRLPLEIAIASAAGPPRIERIELTAATGQFAFAADAEPASVTLDPNTWVLMQVDGVRQALKGARYARPTRRRRSLLCLALAGATARAQYYQTDFPAEEFRSRHAKVFEQIGATAVAVVQGMPQTEGFTLPRQHNTFYYLSGIETPGAYLLLDGRTKKVTIYLPPRNPRLEAAEGACCRRKTPSSSSGCRAPTR